VGIYAGASYGQGEKFGAEAARRMKGPEGGLAAMLAKGHATGGTEAERNKLFAETLGFKTNERTFWGDAVGRFDWSGNIYMEPAEEYWGQVFGTGEAGARDKRQQEIGKYVQDASFRTDVTGLFSEDATVRAAALSRIDADAIDPTKKDTGETYAKQRLAAAARLDDFLATHPEADEKAQQEFIAKTISGSSLAEIRAYKKGAQEIMSDKQRQDYMEYDRRVRRDARSALKNLGDVGVLTAEGTLSKEARARLHEAAGGTYVAGTMTFTRGGRTTTQAIQRLTEGESTMLEHVQSVLAHAAEQKAEGAQADISDWADKERKRRESMTVEQLQASAAELGTTLGAADIEQANMLQRIQRDPRSRRETVAGALGVKIDAATLKRFEGHDDQLAQFLAEKSGAVNDQYAVQNIQRALQSQKQGEVAGSLTDVTTGKGFLAKKEEERRAKEEAENPLQADIRKNGERANAILEAILLSQKGGEAALKALNDKAKHGRNAENEPNASVPEPNQSVDTQQSVAQ
jgi:hypothetical protein